MKIGAYIENNLDPITWEEYQEAIRLKGKVGNTKRLESILLGFFSLLFMIGLWPTSSFLLFAVIFRIGLLLNYRKYLKVNFFQRKIWQVPLTFSWTAEEISVISQVMHFIVDWDKVIAWRESEAILLIYYGKFDSLAIPKRWLKDGVSLFKYNLENRNIPYSSPTSPTTSKIIILLLITLFALLLIPTIFD